MFGCMGAFADLYCCVQLAACRAFAMGYLSAAVQRMQVLLVGPGMVALDIHPELRELFNSALESLDQLPKVQNDKVVPSSLDLSVSF
jgi:NCK-associated protein 1